MNTDPLSYSLYRKIYLAPKDAPYNPGESDLPGACISRNQHGTQYRFPDNSRLTVSRRGPGGESIIRAIDPRGYCVAIAGKRTPIETRGAGAGASA